MKLITIKKPSEMTNKVPTVFNKNFIPLLEGSVIMIYAIGGVGKSFAAIHSAIKFVENNPEKKALLWLSEDPEGENKKRFLKLINSYAINAIDFYDERIVFVESEPVKLTNLKEGNAIPTEEFSKIKAIFDPYSFIVLDPLLQFQGGDENSNTHAGTFMGLLKTWTAEEMKTIMLLHHATFYNGDTTKPRARGAKEFVNSTRGTYCLQRLPIPAAGSSKEEVRSYYEQLEIQLIKDNGLSSTIIQKHGSSTFRLAVLPPLS